MIAWSNERVENSILSMIMLFSFPEVEQILNFSFFNGTENNFFLVDFYFRAIFCLVNWVKSQI